MSGSCQLFGKLVAFYMGVAGCKLRVTGYIIGWFWDWRIGGRIRKRLNCFRIHFRFRSAVAENDMRILILTFGSRGDVQPYAALGKGLQRAGHEVTLCTAEQFEPFITANGLNFSPRSKRW